MTIKLKPRLLAALPPAVLMTVVMADLVAFHLRLLKPIRTSVVATASPSVRPGMMFAMLRRSTMKRWPVAARVTSKRLERTSLMHTRM